MHGLQTIRSLNDRAHNDAAIKRYQEQGKYVVARFAGKDPAGLDVYDSEADFEVAAAAAEKAHEGSVIRVARFFPRAGNHTQAVA